MKLNLNLNSVRYVAHKSFEPLSFDKLNFALRGFDTSEIEGKQLVESVKILDLKYFGELTFFVQGELPDHVSLEIIDKMPLAQQELVVKSHNLCSSRDFRQEIVNNHLPLFHFIEHAMMAVYLAIIRGNSKRNFTAGFFTYPTFEEKGVLCQTYILQNYEIDPSVYLDIIQLAIKYANAIVLQKDMDILSRIKDKVNTYHPIRRKRKQKVMT